MIFLLRFIKVQLRTKSYPFYHNQPILTIQREPRNKALTWKCMTSSPQFETIMLTNTTQQGSGTTWRLTFWKAIHQKKKSHYQIQSNRWNLIRNEERLNAVSTEDCFFESRYQSGYSEQQVATDIWHIEALRDFLILLTYTHNFNSILDTQILNHKDQPTQNKTYIMPV